jgi:hypothetical protein
VVDALDYDNFKMAASNADDDEAQIRSAVYAEVWSDLRRLEAINDLSV